MLDSSGQTSSFPTQYLFELVNPATQVFRDPRVEYDPIHGRFWITIFEYTWGTNGSRFHVAVSLDDSPDTFDVDDPSTQERDGDWYVYTGDGASGAWGDAFQLNHQSIPSALQFEGVPDHPVIHIDEDHLWMVCADYCTTLLGICNLDVFRGAVVTIPLEHGTGQSMLDGQRPSESDLGIVQLQDLEPTDPNDNTLFHYAVQEPFTQWTGGQLFINRSLPVDGSSPAYHDAIRLGGSYHNSSGELEYQWADMGFESVGGEDFYYFDSEGPSRDAQTPESNWRVRTRHSKLDSGVLFRVNNEWRILAGHHVFEADTSGSTPAPGQMNEFRWYLIDPDLGNFPGASWAPEILRLGGRRRAV